MALVQKLQASQYPTSALPAPLPPPALLSQGAGLDLCLCFCINGWAGLPKYKLSSE